MKRKIAKLLVILFILMSACNYVSHKMGFDQPGITSIYPSNYMTDVASDVTVVVTFSKSMDTSKTNEAFSLASSSGIVNGYYRWSGNDTILSFQPGNILNSTEMYTLNISTSAEDIDGNDLKETGTSVFYVNTDLDGPDVDSHAPANDEINVAQNSNIIINFSEAIDINTIYDGFSISPAVDGSFLWDATFSIITFDPLYDLSYGTTYTVTISERITDISGNPLGEQIVFNFTVGDDFVKPTVQSVMQGGVTFVRGSLNSNVEKGDNIIITFSEDVKVDTLYDAITITPSVEFYVTYDPETFQATINFNEDMNSESNYSLDIATTITDLQNNSLNSDYIYHFYTDGVNSIRPSVTGITGPWAWTLGAIETLACGCPTYTDVQINFSAQMEATSVELTIERIYGSGGTPSIIVLDWLPAGQFWTYQFDLEDVQSGNTYKLTLKGGKGGACDLNGNYMEDDFVQIIRF